MFSCNEKTKKKSISIIMRDRQEARLVEGRVGAGELIHWPLSLGDSPAIILCLGEPWWLLSCSLTARLPPSLPLSTPTQVVALPTHSPGHPWLSLRFSRRSWTLWFRPLPHAKMVALLFLEQGACEELVKSPPRVSPPEKPRRVVLPRRSLCPLRPPAPSAIAASCYKNHTGINSHGSFQSPQTVTSGVQNFYYGLEACLSYLLSWLFLCYIVCWQCVLFLRHKLGVAGSGALKE